MSQTAPRALAAYAALSLPLAMAALPVYVQVPKLYGETLGLGLAATGMLLLAARLVDAVQDPFFGWLSDLIAGRRLLGLPGRAAMTAIAVPPLGLGMVGLFAPPGLAGVALGAWFFVALLLVYSAYSALNIAYYGWGADISAAYHERTRISLAREAAALVGVLIAAALPAALATRFGTEQGYALFAVVLLPVLGVCAWITLRHAPRGRPAGGARPSPLRAALADRVFRRFLLVFVLNGIAAAIPASLVLFFIDDVVGASHLTPAFLAIYFLAGALGMPVWLKLARDVSKSAAWLASMALGLAAFVWAYALAPGDIVAYGLVCLLSGLSLGADLGLPPALVADLADRGARDGARPATGGYYGVWNLVNKANFALAAGIALPLLDRLGYRPEADDGSGLGALALVYALLPCALKLAAGTALLALPLEPRALVRAPARA
jgi:Na+/melibiose symporter-like transporter